MAEILSGLAEPDEPNPVPGDITVLVTVPEEFAGVSLGELNAREARINGMEVEGICVTISATLPASHYKTLVEVIKADTQDRGRVALAEADG